MSPIATTDIPAMPPNDTTGPSEGQDEDSGLDYIIECQEIPGLVSKDTSRRLGEMHINYAAVHGYVSIAVCLVGILFNSASIIVLTRKHMISSTNILLTWIAISDLLIMLCYLPFAVQFYVLHAVDPDFGPFMTPDLAWIRFLLFFICFPLMCHSISVWLTIALAIFRCIYISAPITGAYYCSKRRAKLVVVLVIILTLLAFVPNFMIVTYHYFPGFGDRSGNVSDTVSSTAGYYSNATATPGDSSNAQAASDGGFYYLTFRESRLVNINYWIHGLLLKMIPCFMLIILTVLLINAITRANRNRLRLTSTQLRTEGSRRHAENNRTSRMLLIVVVLFTVTELPHAILHIMAIFISCFQIVVYGRLGDLIDLLVLVQSGTNFVLYCTMSRQFRHTFTSIIKQKWLELSTLATEGATTSRRTPRDTSVPTVRGGPASAGGSTHESWPSLQSAVIVEESPHDGCPLETESAVSACNGTPVD